MIINKSRIRSKKIQPIVVRIMCFLYQKVQDFAYKAKNGTKDTVFHVKSTKKNKKFPNTQKQKYF